MTNKQATGNGQSAHGVVRISIVYGLNPDFGPVRKLKFVAQSCLSDRAEVATKNCSTFVLGGTLRRSAIRLRICFTRSASTSVGSWDLIDATISSSVMFVGRLPSTIDSLNVATTLDSGMEGGLVSQSLNGGNATIEIAMIATKTSIERSRNCINRVFIRRWTSNVESENLEFSGAPDYFSHSLSEVIPRKHADSGCISLAGLRGRGPKFSVASSCS